MSPNPELAERFERAFAEQPVPRSAAVRVAAGRRALRRRRAATGLAAGAFSAAVVFGTTVVVEPTPPTVAAGDPTVPDGVDRQPTPTAPLDDSLDLDVKPWPYTDQGADPQPLWIDENGVIYRHSAEVTILGVDTIADIIDVDTTRPTGSVLRYDVRWRGVASTFLTQIVDGVAMGGGSQSPGGGAASGERWYFEKDGEATELFTDPAGVTPEGRIEPRAGAIVSRERPAVAFDQSRFEGTPNAGVVDYLGTRYYALVGYQPNAHDVIVVEPAPPGQSFEDWVVEVRDRMRAGEDLG